MFNPPESLLYCYTYCFRCLWFEDASLAPPKKTCARLKETKWTMVFPHSRYTTTTTLWVYIRRNCIEKPNQVSTLDPKNIVQWKCAVGGARWIEIMKVEGKVWLCATFFSPFISGTLRPRQTLFSEGGTGFEWGLCPDYELNISCRNAKWKWIFFFVMTQRKAHKNFQTRYLLFSFFFYIIQLSLR